MRNVIHWLHLKKWLWYWSSLHKIRLWSWWERRKSSSSYLYSTTQRLSLLSGVCPISDRKKNRIEQVEWYICSVFKLLHCWIKDTVVTLFPIISFIACRPPNISAVKGSVMDCISASKTAPENVTYVFSIRLETPWGQTEVWLILVQHLSSSRKTCKLSGR